MTEISTYFKCFWDLVLHRWYAFNWKHFLFDIITARKQSLWRLCFYTCLSFCSQGVSAPVHAGIHIPPWTRGIHPPDQRQTCPRDQRQTRGRGRPEADTRLRSRPPPPFAVLAGRYGQQADGTHPTGMHTCYVMRMTIYSGLNFRELWNLEDDKCNVLISKEQFFWIAAK